MAWGNVLLSDNLSVDGINMLAVQRSSVDWKQALAPGEIAHLEVRMDFVSGQLDLTVYVWGSTADSPGAVPDSTQSQAGSDWSPYAVFVIPGSSGSETDNVYHYFKVEGVRTFAISVQLLSHLSSPGTFNARVSIGS